MATPQVDATSATPPPLVLADLQAWATAGDHTVRFRQGDDVFELSAQGLRIEAGPDLWTPVAPRLAFPASGELPFLRADLLAPLEADAAPYAALFSIDGSPPAAWDAVASQLPAGDSGLLGEAGQLMRVGLLTPEQAATALDQARPAEPLDHAIARLGLVGLDAWIDAFVGRQFLTPPASRPFADRLGMRLLAKHAITQGQLKEALAHQAAQGAHRPLGQLLGIHESELARALAAQPELHPQYPEADGLGEVLIRWGSVSRSDWLRARRGGAEPEAALVKSGKLMPGHLARARAYREALSRHLAARTVRLGQVLVERGLDREVLAKALAWQVDQPLHLAELMVLHRLIGPAEAARALGEQAGRHRQLAEAGLPPLEPRPQPVVLAGPRAQKPRRPFPRQAFILAVAGILALVYALAYGYRWSGRAYGWLDVFFPVPPRPPAAAPGGAVHEISESKAQKGPTTVQRVERLDLPLGRPPAAAAGTVSAAENLDARIPALTPADLPENLATAAIARMAAATPGARASRPQAMRTASPDSVGLNQVIPSLGPNRRFPAPSFANEHSAEPLTQPSFGPLSAGQPGVAKFGYPMERALVLETPAPRPTEPDEPAAMKRFRADLARLRAAEARHRRQGQALRAKGRDTEAQQALALAENVRRSQSVFRARIGEAYFREGDLVAAAAELRGAAHDDPTFALPHYFLGAIAADRGDRQAATSAYRTYLRLAPEGEFAAAARDGLKRFGEKPTP